MHTAHRYYLTEWLEEGERQQYRFSMSDSAIAFVLLMEDRGIKVKLTRVNDKV